jgi:outer membrane receptor protein involved in Fe transport
MMRPSALFARTALVCGLSGLSFAFDASAQTQPAPAEEADEIVVTAQYRAQDIQDVPLSVTAFEAEELQARGVDDFVDYARSVPGLSFNNRGPNRSNIVMRGLSPLTGAASVELYLDGIGQSNASNNPDFRLFDVERVEILRGPQGTLYGEGSMGGTIKIITTPPQLDGFGARFEATGSNTDEGGSNSGFNALVNIPVDSGVAAFRISGFSRDESGWIDNAFDGEEDINDYESSGVRAAFRLHPIRALDIQLIANYQDDHVGNLDVRTQGLGEYEAFAPLDNFEDQTNTQYTALINYEFATGAVEAVIGYNEVDDFRMIDSAGVLGAPGIPVSFASDSDSTSTELRYLSDLDGALNFVLGFYWRDRVRDNTLTVIDFGGPGVDFVVQAGFGTETTALYGEGYYTVGDWTATVGARAFREQVRTPSNRTFGGVDVTDPTADRNPLETFEAITSKFGLSYQATEDIMFFANAAEGFRSGGSNPIPSAHPAYTPSFDPDGAWSYELGVKSQFLDRRVTLNGTIYHVDWEDMQILGVPANPALGFTTNAGAAHTEGLDVEFIWRPSAHLNMSVGGAWIEAELDEPAQGAPAGARLPFVPEQTFNASISYRVPLWSDFEGVARVDWSYVGEATSNVAAAPGSEIAAYDIGNVRLGIENDRYSATLFVNNVGNEVGVTTAFTSGEYVSRPRTIGVTLGARF